MDPNRLHLNFPRGQGPDRSYETNNQQVYPTTPSTFPQPVFGNAQAGGQNAGYGNAQIANNPNNNYGDPSSYFNNAQYQQQQYGQSMNPQYGPGQSYQPQGGSQQPYSPRFANDPNAGLARQFSNQTLGAGQQRQQSPFGRQQGGGQQRPGTGSSQSGGGQQRGGQQSSATHLSPSSGDPSAPAEVPPEQDPEKYSSNVAKRVMGLHMHVETFFKDNITRARDRNSRAKDLEGTCSNPRSTDGDIKEAKQKVFVQETNHIRRLRTVESPKNYSTVKVIGKGAFGEVKLVQRKNDAKIFALKCLVKAEMFKKDQLAHVRAERDILAEADSPWVVKLHTTFQDKTFLYMLMEFLPGGDLMTMLIKYETFAPDIARFYMAEILLAIEAVHKLGFIHRDIKPDNILLDKTGHLKLTDFGLSTGFHKQHEASYYQNLLRGHSSARNQNRNSVNLDQINLTVSNRGQINNWRKSRRTMAYSTVGTPDYIAPEIFSGQGYTFSCDWWSLGAIMYESIIGWPPFCADDPHDTYRKIVDWRNTLYIPDDLPQPLDHRAENLIRSLLCDAPNRVGHVYGAHGASEIKQHPYFAGVDWGRIRHMHAPFQPQLRSAIDTEYFPTDEIDQTDHTAAWESQARQISEEHDTDMTLPFIGYTFRRFPDDD